MKLMTGLSFNNLIEFYQNKHNVRFDNSRINVLRCIFAKGVTFLDMPIRSMTIDNFQKFMQVFVRT